MDSVTTRFTATSGWTALLYNIRMIKDTIKTYIYNILYSIYYTQYTFDIWYTVLYIYTYKHICAHVRLCLHMHIHNIESIIFINMLHPCDSHRPGWVFSKIQELFSFQQDVAATKKNPMCWLRRAEAEKHIMTWNWYPWTPTTHGNMKVYSP